MISRISLASIIILAAAAWGAMVWFEGAELTWTMLRPFGVVLGFISIVISAYNRILWKVWPLNLLSYVPNLSGKWTVEIESNYHGKQNGKNAAPVQGTATIRQTHASLSIRVETSSQKSYLIAHSFIKHGDEVYEIAGVYQSDPELELRGSQSEIHYGAFKYTAGSSPIKEISGHYWTDRHTRGKIKFSKQEAG
jgi:SMODS-associating 2TM, beta-strand rich effector domain